MYNLNMRVNLHSKPFAISGALIMVFCVTYYAFYLSYLHNNGNIKFEDRHDTTLRTRQDIIKQVYSNRSTDPSHVKAFPSLGCYIMDKYNQSLFQVDVLNFLCQPGFDVEKNMTMKDAEEIYYRYD